MNQQVLNQSGGLVILHVTAPARVGGLEKVVEALAAGHVRAGHAVHVAAVVERDEDARQFFEPLVARGVETHPIVIPSRAYLRERDLLRAVFRVVRPTVVHTHGYRPDVIAGGAARGLGIPTVTTVHGFTGGDWRNRLYEMLQVLAFRRFDAVVAVSQPLAELLRRRGVPAKHLRMIANAWSPSRAPLARSVARSRLDLAPDAFCVGWLGRLGREKGADVLLEAVPRMPSDVHVSFIGDGSERPVLEARAAELRVSERMRWHGVVPDAGELLSAFDAFALSSRTEGTPIALFEAMAAGVPVVATRVGGVPNVVTEEDALLVPSEDPTALALAIQAIHEDPAAAARRAASATRRLETTFAVEPWLAAYENLYHEVARAGRRP